MLLLRRLLNAVVLLLAISFIVYLLLFPAVGNIAYNVLGENASLEQVELLQQQLGLDRPFIVQYLDWLGSVFTGDFGRSYFSSQPVANLIAVRLPVTLSLLVLVTIFSGVVAFALGTYAAVKRGWIDRVLLILVTVGDALPAFILAIFFISIFSFSLEVLPAIGYVQFADSPADWAAHLILPVTALSILGIAGVAQQVRSTTLTVLGADYIRTLRSRGLSNRRVVFTSVLRNSSTNGLTALAVQVVAILGGAVVIEQVFALPGLGSLVVESTTRADIPLILGIVLAYAVIIVVINLLVDLVVAWLNPKARLS
jgi:peptide/nickel transport system permease protein